MAVTLTSARFVGRERELARIAVALERSAEGIPTTLFVTGSGGLGASRLLVETRRRLSGLPDAPAVVAARAFPAWRGRPFAPISAALGPLLGPLPDASLAELVGPGGDALALVVPELRQRLAALDLLPRLVPTAAPERRLARILEAVVGLLGRLGEHQPVLLLVEDLHVADGATRALVSFLARTGRQQRIAVIGTYQPDELTRSHPLQVDLRAIAELPRPVERIELQPLDRAELAELIEGIAGERPSASMLLLVTERSGGNPLLAEELLAARRELSGASLTGSLERLVTARLALRSPECRRVVRLLALAAEPLSRARVAEIATSFESLPPTGVSAAGRTGRPRRLPPRSTSAPRRREALLDADLAAGLAEALEVGVLTEDPLPERGGGAHSRTDGGVGFRHELIARAVAADLLPGARGRYEAAIARAATSPSSAVPHLLAAYDLDGARLAAIEAAAVAEEVGSGQDALTQFEIALELHAHAAETGAPSGPAAAGTPPSTPGVATSTGSVAADEANEAATAEPSTRTAIRRLAPVPPLIPEERRLPELRARAADAAFAAGDPARAAAFAEVAIGALDERLDWPALGLLWERLGRYRRAAGDHEGAVRAHRRAVAIVPPAASLERARVLAALAQVTMLDGSFSEAEKCAREAIGIAEQVGEPARAELVHATCTLAVVKAWGDDPEAGVRMLSDVKEMAAALGELDDLFRAYANLTTALDLLGRREEAIAVATEGIAEAERYGQATVYGNFLRGNAADSLFVLGRWEESRALSSEALAWSPAGIGFLSPLLNLATVEIETSAAGAAGRLGQLLLELETVPDVQFSVPAYQAAASYALWQEDPADARRVVERGWARIRDTEDWVLIARMAASVLEVYAAIAADAQRRRNLEALAAVRAAGTPVVERARAAVEAAGVAGSIGSRREADTFLEVAAAFQARVEGRDDPETWRRLADGWQRQGAVYRAARARWREAESLLVHDTGRVGRSRAVKPLREAALVASRLGARPLLRALQDLAGRARISLPIEQPDVVSAVPSAAAPPAGSAAAAGQRDGADGRDARGGRGGRDGTAVGAAPSTSALVRGFVAAGQPTRKNTFALSPREHEVLALIAEGRTNHEIGDRLFISHRTVGIHVGNILAKLGVSGRVEAAAVAIRLGLTEQSRPAPTRTPAAPR